MSMSIGPTLTDAKYALQAIAHAEAGIVRVVTTNAGTTVNGQAISDLHVPGRIASVSSSPLAGAAPSGGSPGKDRVVFSANAMATLSRDQIALAVIQGRKADAGSSKPVGSSAAGTVSTAVQTSKALSSGTTATAATSDDPATVLAAYAAESPTDRFYSQNPDPAELFSLFAGNPQQQASFVAAYSSRTLNIQAGSDLAAPGYTAATNYTDNGESSAGGPGGLDFRAMMAVGKNVVTSSDGVTGVTVISW